MLNSLFMVADPFSKKYMILSYSFGDHSSHQSSTHPRLRSKSAAKFVCRQELASAAPASAVAAAVQPASASLGFGIYYTLSSSDIYHLSKSFVVVMSAVNTFISVIIHLYSRRFFSLKL